MPTYYSFHPLPSMDRRWRPKVEELAPNCPRCDSSNTKFCYYNNYCLTQPRYLCKGCRRYWTKGGSLRNIPAGGGCRKSRRGKSVKPNSAVSSSLPSPKNSFRPDHALENMSGRTGGSFLSPDQPIDLAQLYANFPHQSPEFKTGSLEGQNRAEIGAEVARSNNFVEKRLIEEFMGVQGSGFGEVLGYNNNNYLMGSSNYGMETDLTWVSSRFQGIGISEMAQQSAVGLFGLEAFL